MIEAAKYFLIGLVIGALVYVIRKRISYTQSRNETGRMAQSWVRQRRREEAMRKAQDTAPLTRLTRETPDKKLKT